MFSLPQITSHGACPMKKKSDKMSAHARTSRRVVPVVSCNQMPARV